MQNLCTSCTCVRKFNVNFLKLRTVRTFYYAYGSDTKLGTYVFWMLFWYQIFCNGIHSRQNRVWIFVATVILRKKHFRSFFKRGGCRPFWKVINIFACTCPNHSGVGAIDNLDRFEQVFDTYYIPEASEKIFTDDISMVRPQKMYIFGVLKAFISNFTYYNLY